jgi:hypothetical protein
MPLSLTKYYVCIRASGYPVSSSTDREQEEEEARFWNKDTDMSKHHPYRVVECVTLPPDAVCATYWHHKRDRWAIEKSPGSGEVWVPILAMGEPYAPD